MTELKTLKDIRILPFGFIEREDTVKRSDLRQEAIKRAKSYLNTLRTSPAFKIDSIAKHFLMGQLQEIMEFANITEEDLK